MKGKEKEDIHFVDYCRSTKPLLQSYENKMAYEYEFKESSHILNNHLSQLSCLFWSVYVQVSSWKERDFWGHN